MDLLLALLALVLRAVTILFMVFICVPLSSEGARNLLEITATPLHKTGWPLTYLGRTVELRRIDLAYVMALMMMGCVLISLEMLTYFYGAELRITNFRRMVWATGTVLICCDAILMWKGLAVSGFFGSAPLFAATVMTALYLGVLVFLATLINFCQGKIK